MRKSLEKHERPISATVPLQLNHSKPPPLAVVGRPPFSLLRSAPNTPAIHLTSLYLTTILSSLILAPRFFSPSWFVSFWYLPHLSLFLNWSLSMLFALSPSFAPYLRLSLPLYEYVYMRVCVHAYVCLTLNISRHFLQHLFRHQSRKSITWYRDHIVMFHSRFLFIFIYLIASIVVASSWNM